jgi:hypothetical protein
MPLFGAITLFVIFLVNVGFGAVLHAPFLNDVSELLLLCGVAILFVITIIKKEADAKK